ncbi:M20 metallopeptidase family protein [Ihubacter sp. rT4E-8]|uniref:M20 metallopeptidase family protein n=1 Tax=Ihubacter sp. rT4E-8 TaxID=3242369 RepID=UPI003CEE679F
MNYDKKQLLAAVDSVFDEAVSFRRQLHMHPELSEHETETARLIQLQLQALGIPFESNIAGNGISAVIYGKDRSRGVGIRADIDALPVTEKVEIPFKSQNTGIMHACGHDIHTAILLGTAKVLLKMQDQLPASVRLFFQPSEETIGGARQMIDAGCLENPKISSVLGLHVDTGTDAGSVEFIPGAMNAACCEFQVRVIGKSCHGAHPTDGIDALLPACTMVTSLQSILTRRMDPTDSVLITVGKFNSGVKENVISGEAIFCGTIRTLDMKSMANIKTYLADLCHNTAAAFGASCEVEFASNGYPTLENDDQLLKWVMDSAKEILGAEHVKLTKKPSLGADDFAFFCHSSKGLYYNIGARKPGEKDAHPIHSDLFCPDEECIRTGILTQVAAILKIFEEEDI